ncbi:MAG: fused MFS/spermidine synthase [Usitatibacter sp.]
MLFELFFLSGFCGLLYQVVWVRLGFASFGIITPVVSVVISVFMLGLAFGAWISGRLVAALTRRTRLSAIYLYAFAELVIGAGAFAVPGLFGFGESALRHLGEANSFEYLALSAVAIALSIFPWCFAMGATFPLMMAFVREHRDAGERSFSHLYLANVIGASVGALLTAGVLVEVLGFRRTLAVAGLVNFVIAAAAVLIGSRTPRAEIEAAGAAQPVAEAVPARPLPWVAPILFTTGLASLAMEVVWTRAFAPVLGTQVYAFAALLVVYLVATWVGSWRYRRDLAAGRVVRVGVLLLVVAAAALLPVVLNDPRLVSGFWARAFVALASIFPLCAALGYLTPRLVDDSSRGDPRIAGRAYALNVLGCILGPLLASYLLLPLLGAALSLVLLALPLIAFAVIFRADLSPRWRAPAAVACVALLACGVFLNVSYEDPCTRAERHCEVRRDHAATVVSMGEGMDKRLLVNGFGITGLTPITKFMAHLPLAFHRGEPRSALVICFGMGTTYRSLLSWNVPTTAVELVPSVREAFPYYHADAAAVLRDPNGRIVVDDGRRFLNRTTETYDVIVVDPPPPIEAAGSSLLYSTQFHEAVRRHLKPGGIFQTWFPFGEESIARAIAGSLADVFPYVRVYRSVEGWGLHFLASMEPIDDIGPTEMLRRMPPAAQKDLAEWSRDGIGADVASVLAKPVPFAQLVPEQRSLRITDDRPYNEYFLLRRTLARP